jgi:hypothetical protein
MKFDRRFLGVCETRQRFGLVSGGRGGVNKPQLGEPRKPRATPWESWRSAGTSPERAIQRVRTAFVGDVWAAPSALHCGPVSGGLGGFRDSASLRAE